MRLLGFCQVLFGGRLTSRGFLIHVRVLDKKSEKLEKLSKEVKFFLRSLS